MLFYRFNTSRTKNIAKRSISVFLCFFIYFNSITNAYASTIAGWNITNQIAQGASTLYNATKSGIENGVNIVKTSTAKITPSVSNVSKILRGGAYGYAISVAVEQMLGFTVDWILDPANNQIKYYVDGQPKWFSIDTSQYYASRDAACFAGMNYRFGRTYTITRYSNQSDSYYCYFNLNGSEGYVTVKLIPTAQEERKIPLDAVSTQVISNAESQTDEQKKAGSQAVTTAAAQDMLANDPATQSDVETQLNANAKTQTSDQATGNTKPNEANPEITDISLSFPAFCGWAPTICQAANVVINFPITLTDWWNRSTAALTEAYTFAKTKVQEVSDYFKEEQQDNTDNEVEIDTSIAPVDPVNISIGDNQCPSLPITLNFGFFSVDTDLSPVYLCEIAEGTKPFFIALGFFLSAGIVGRRNT